MHRKKITTIAVLLMTFSAMFALTVYVPSRAVAEGNRATAQTRMDYDPSEEENATALNTKIKNVAELLIYLAPAVTAVLFVVALGRMQYAKASDEDSEEAARWKRRSMEILAIGLVITLVFVIIGAFYGAI